MTFIVAEVGVNHQGDIEIARTLIDTAKECGADAVKFQVFDAEKLEPPGARRDMLKPLELNRDAIAELANHAQSRELQFFATPFDIDSLNFLVETIKVRQIKIASGDIGNEPLLEAAAKSGCTVILSTGASGIEDTRRAVRFLHQVRRGGLIVLHCVSAYPAPPEDMNLKVLHNLRHEFPHVTIGLSDHSEGIAVPIAAAAMGAAMIEKHLTLDCAMEGPDHKASADPLTFKSMVDGIRIVEKALGDGQKRVMASEAPVKEIVRMRTAHREVQAKVSAPGADAAEPSAS